MPKITFVLYEHCLSSSITSLIDAFSICNLLHEDTKTKGSSCETPSSLFDMKIAAITREPVLTNGGVWVQPDAEFESVKGSDLILIPPRLYAQQPKDEELSHLIPWLIESYQKGVRIAAMCTGSFVLALTGLLDRKIATTNWLFVKKFQRQFPKVKLKPERILTEDEGLICSGAMTAMYNLALYVIEIFGSDELSRICSRILLVDHNRKSQLPYMATIFRKNLGDKQILSAQHWLEDNYANQFTIDDVANWVGLSPRHFKRRFKKATGENPSRYLQQMRLEIAKTMLEKSHEHIEIITYQIGYEDSRTFRRLFKQYTSLSPREYRARFRVI
jgi:transcriptional regulator GlxA family with amidase domain